MKPALLAEPTVLGAQAWRVTFDNTAKQPGALAIREPRRVIVNTQAVGIDAALSESPSEDDAGISVVWLPAGDGAPAGLEKSVERWVTEGSRGSPAVRATIRTNRVLWTDRRALVYSSPDQWPDALDAVLRFTLIARDTSELEEQMRTVWASLKGHVPLSHAVTYRQRRLQAQVNQMTEAITRIRVSFLQLYSAIEQTDLTLSSASKRLCAELILQAAIYDRLDVVEEPIQFALDHYELANTRLIEHKNAAQEYFFAAVITITLLFQTAIILLEQIIK
jgi:hypothetical protein